VVLLLGSAFLMRNPSPLASGILYWAIVTLMGLGLGVWVLMAETGTGMATRGGIGLTTTYITIAKAFLITASAFGALSLFGYTRLATTDIELLEAVAVHHELHLWLPHPSAPLWDALAGLHGAVLRRADTSHRLVGHPLLATLGRDVRELQRSLPATVDTDVYLPGSSDRPACLLGWLQTDLAADRIGDQGRALRADDRSVQVHSCHGPARQVDVLREVLLGLLADDETTEPTPHPKLRVARVSGLQSLDLVAVQGWIEAAGPAPEAGAVRAWLMSRVPEYAAR
jgi:hypothetical protein